MAQDFGDLYANVIDFGADDTGWVDATAAIQAAIDSGLQVLFPAGTYLLKQPLEFNNDVQYTQFLSGAVLNVVDSGCVRITGTEQMIEGMRISIGAAHVVATGGGGRTPTNAALPDPLAGARSPTGAGVTSQPEPLPTLKASRLTSPSSSRPASKTAGRGTVAAATSSLVATRLSSGFGVSSSVPLKTAGRVTTGSPGTLAPSFGSGGLAAVRMSGGAASTATPTTSGVKLRAGPGLRSAGVGAGEPARLGAGMNAKPLAGVLGGASSTAVLYIQGADDLLMFDLMIGGVGDEVSTIGGVDTLVSVSYTSRCAFVGGQLSGPGMPDSAGVRMESGGGGVRGVSYYGMEFRNFDNAVVIAGSADTIVLTDCSFRDNASSAVLLRGSAPILAPRLRCLSLQGCRMEASPVYVWLDVGTALEGGEVAGCCFGTLAGGKSTASVFRMDGSVDGFTVSGCFYLRSTVFEESAIWQVGAMASLTRTCDLFNHWAGLPVASGSNASQVVRFSGAEGGELAVASPSARLDSASLSCFGGGPATQPASYQVGVYSGARPLLTTANTRQVLSALIAELAGLGLLSLTPGPRTWIP